MPSAMGLPAVLWDTIDIWKGYNTFFGERCLEGEPTGNDVEHTGKCSRFLTPAGAFCFVEVGTVFRLSKLSAVFTMLEDSRRKEIAMTMERSILTFEMFHGSKMFTIPANELYSSIEAFKTLEYSLNPIITFAALSVFRFKLFVPDDVKPFSMRLLLTGWKLNFEDYSRMKTAQRPQERG